MWRVSLSFMRQIPACLNKMHCLLFEFLYFVLFSTYEVLDMDFKIKCLPPPPPPPGIGNFSAPVLD